jgi:hypothetical protein
MKFPEGVEVKDWRLELGQNFGVEGIATIGNSNTQD